MQMEEVAKRNIFNLCLEKGNFYFSQVESMKITEGGIQIKIQKIWKCQTVQPQQ